MEPDNKIPRVLKDVAIKQPNIRSIIIVGLPTILLPIAFKACLKSKTTFLTVHEAAMVEVLDGIEYHTAVHKVLRRNSLPKITIFTEQVPYPNLYISRFLKYHNLRIRKGLFSKQQINCKIVHFDVLSKLTFMLNNI